MKKTVFVIIIMTLLSSCFEELNNEENNQSPIIYSVPVLSLALNSPDESLSYRVDATDPEGNALSYTLQGNPTWIAIEQSTGIISIDFTEAVLGDHTYSVIVSDGIHSTTETITTQITQNLESNEIPAIVEIPAIIANAEQVASQQINVQNVINQTLTYTLSESVNWVQIDDESGLISVNANKEHKGDHTFTAIISNGTTEVTQKFNVRVIVINASPQIEDIPVISMISGEKKTYTVSAKDNDTDPLSYSLVNADSWVTIDNNSGIITFISAEEHVGTHQLTVQVSDGKANTSKAFSVVVSDPPLKRALATGDHTLVSENELLAALAAQLKSDAAHSNDIIEALYQGVTSLSWPLNQDTMHIGGYISSNRNTKIISGNADKNNNPINVTFGIVGEHPNGGRYAYLTANPTAVRGDAGLDTLTKNLFNWLIGEEKTSLNVVIAQIPNRTYFRHHREMVSWFNDHYPNAYTLNNFRECDYENLIPCIQNKKPDLVFLSSDDHENRGANALTAAYQYLKENKIPTLMASIGRSAAPMITPYLFDIGAHQTNSNYWSLYKTLNSTKNDVLTANAPQSDLVAKFQSKSFDITPINTCTGTMFTCTSSDFIKEFRKGADLFYHDAVGLDRRASHVFSLPRLESTKLALLLADKYRSQIDYPITHAEPLDWYKALFADWVVSYARNNNLAQTDLGEYIIDKKFVLKGENAHYKYSETTTDTQVSRVLFPNQWTTTGWYALPGKPVTLTRTGTDTHTVYIRLHYARLLTNRVHTSKIYTKPLDLTTTRLSIPPQGSVTFSTPYGASIYLDHRDGTSSQVTATGIAKHPTITNFSDPQQIIDFEKTLNSTEIPHIDLKTTAAELHIRRDKFTSAIGATYPNTQALLKGISEDHLDTVYSLAAFKVQGKTLSESTATAAMDLCIAKFGSADCLDETLHIRTIIQHANYDQYANCGVGCAGNPWDSGGYVNPRGWLDNHELGHNLQTGRTRAAYVSETNRNTWSKYSDRSGEASNNIFPYYVMWKGWYITDGNTDIRQDSHMNGKDIFFAYQSEIDGLTNENGDSVLYHSNCRLLGTSQTRHEAIWSSSAYAINNSYRMGFYIQMALRTDAIMPKFNNGFDIYPSLYLHDRIYGRYATDEATWNNNRQRLGFAMFDFTTPHGTVNKISSNDFMLVSLSYLTEYDWQPYFELYGLRNSDLAKQQSAAHGTKGSLDIGVFVHERDLPDATVTGNLTFLPLGPTLAGTTWPRDNSTPADCGK